MDGLVGILHSGLMWQNCEDGRRRVWWTDSQCADVSYGNKNESCHRQITHVSVLLDLFVLLNMKCMSYVIVTMHWLSLCVWDVVVIGSWLWYLCCCSCRTLSYSSRRSSTCSKTPRTACCGQSSTDCVSTCCCSPTASSVVTLPARRSLLAVHRPHPLHAWCVQLVTILSTVLSGFPLTVLTSILSSLEQL